MRGKITPDIKREAELQDISKEVKLHQISIEAELQDISREVKLHQISREAELQESQSCKVSREG